MLALFAVHSSNRFVHVTEVERGLACDCRCAVCGEPVIARQGDVREHHFAHSSNEQPCSSSYESDLHRFAKQVIIEAHGLVVPVNKAAARALGLADDEGPRIFLACTGVKEEVGVGNRRPDLLAATAAGASVAIEIAYSSFCDVQKCQDYEAMRLPALEIDLQVFTPTEFDVARVKRALLEDVTCKSWLSPECLESPETSPNPPVIPSPILVPQRQFLPEEIVTVRGQWISVKELPAATSPSRLCVTTLTWSPWCALLRASIPGSTAAPISAGLSLAFGLRRPASGCARSPRRCNCWQVGCQSHIHQ